MKATFRNQLKGVVKKIILGQVMAEVKVDIGGNQIAAVITKEALEEVGIKEGDEVFVLIKATAVALAK
jgi:molybdate transport system regulatory protein